MLVALSRFMPSFAPESVRPPRAKHSVSVHDELARWRDTERELEAANVPLPLQWRSTWLEAHDAKTWFLASRGVRGAIVMSASRTRAMPGHVVLRAERVRPADPVTDTFALFEAARTFALEAPRVLRLELATFSFDEQSLVTMGDELGRLGFRRSPDPIMYERTRVLDLTGSEEEISHGLHATARRHIRATIKNPDLELRVIRDPEEVDAMARLVRETRARTGGGDVQRPWAEHLRVAREHPELIAFVGLYERDTGELLSFASGQMHGDHAVYADAASTRPLLHIPLGYAPAWELVRWARRQGARWFDFGGITTGSFHRDTDHDPLGGISDFKRGFGGHEQRVSEEWIFEPHRGRALLAGAVTAGANWIRSRR